MSDAEGILLLAEPAVEKKLAAELGRCTSVASPYEALKSLAGGGFSSVVLTAPRGQFASLCRAARRLAPKSRLFALCPPAAEPDVRELAPGPLDDYFIYPPSPEDLAVIRGRPAEAPAERPPTTVEAADVGELILASSSVVSLESAVADLLARRAGLRAQWVNAGQSPPKTRTVAAMGQDPRRLLVCDESAPVDESLARSLGELLPALLANARRTESLQRLAITDHLTGAYNRRYFYHMTEQILARARQQGQDMRVTLLLYDIDDFKHYNDTYGYAAGDEILRETAALMKRITRTHDIVARIGGDEFAVLFWDAQRPRSPSSKPPETAYALADRFMRAVRKYSFPSLGPEAQGALTVSGGLASFPRDGQTVRELLRSANQAIKAAKLAGKNGIRIVGDGRQVE